MRRRHFLLNTSVLLFTAASPAHAADPPTLDDVLRRLEALQKKPARTVSGWPLGAMLQHLAQSVEMSMDGYPAPRSALFQHTAGTAAFAFFKWRGQMSHDLSEPIPGAPPLVLAGTPEEGAARLRNAIERFQKHAGALQPHFAYGKLDKADYARAHGMHVAEHWTLVSS